MRRGDVQCDRLPHRFRDEVKTWPVLDGYKNVNVCSSGAGVWKQLSPMKLGPFRFTEFYADGSTADLSATNLENLWQSAKVWEGEEGPDGFPTPAWYTRRSLICNDSKAHRHIRKGRGVNPNVPLYSWWQGKKLSYDEARRTIYIPLYAERVKATEAWKRLVALVASGKSVQILGYDGRPFANLRDELHDLTRPFGHELVLCAMLRGELDQILVH